MPPATHIRSQSCLFYVRTHLWLEKSVWSQAVATKTFDEWSEIFKRRHRPALRAGIPRLLCALSPKVSQGLPFLRKRSIFLENPSRGAARGEPMDPESRRTFAKWLVMTVVWGKEFVSCLLFLLRGRERAWSDVALGSRFARLLWVRRAPREPATPHSREASGEGGIGSPA